MCALGDLRFLNGVFGVDEAALRAPTVFDLTGVAGTVVLGGGQYGVDGLRMPLAPLVVTILMVVMVVDRRMFWMIVVFEPRPMTEARSCQIENPTGEVVMSSVTLYEIEVIADARSK